MRSCLKPSPLREPANSRFFDRYMGRGEQLMTAMFPDYVRISSFYQTISRNNVGKSGVSNLIPHSIRDLNLLKEDQHSASCKPYSCQKSFFVDIDILLAGILKAVSVGTELVSLSELTLDACGFQGSGFGQACRPDKAHRHPGKQGPATYANNDSLARPPA